MDLPSQFLSRFRASDFGYGLFRLQETQTICEPVTAELWLSHLGGTIGLGLSPNLPDGTCTWGAAEINLENLDLPALARRVAAAGLPLVVARGKLGVACLFLFVSEPAPVALLRSKLTEWVAVLNAPSSVRIYPAEDGAWLSLPYQGGDASSRYALGSEGQALGAAEFLAFAEKLSVNPTGLDGIRATSLHAVDHAGIERQQQQHVVAPEDPNDPYAPFRDGFSCLIPMLQADAHNEAPNMALYHLAVYARLKYGEETAQVHLKDWVDRFFTKKLPSRQIGSITRPAMKPGYKPRCKEPPASGFCKAGACMAQPFGIGQIGLHSPQSDGATEFDALSLGELVKVKSDPPLWRWMINDEPVEVTSAELLSQAVFLSRILDATSLVVKTMSAVKWLDMLSRHTQSAREVEVPEDATKVGQIMQWVQKFCTQRSVSHNIDELAADKTVTVEGRTFFQATELLSWLKFQKVEGISGRVLWAVLEPSGVDHGTKTIKGKDVKYWSIPAFPEQTEEFEVPAEIDEPPF